MLLRQRSPSHFPGVTERNNYIPLNHLFKSLSRTIFLKKKKIKGTEGVVNCFPSMLEALASFPRTIKQRAIRSYQLTAEPQKRNKQKLTQQ